MEESSKSRSRALIYDGSRTICTRKAERWQQEESCTKSRLEHDFLFCLVFFSITYALNSHILPELSLLEGCTIDVSGEDTG